jgi:uncharacterized membrane protein YfcA
MNAFILILVLIIGLLGSFIDSAFKMGYGIATPSLILLGFNPILVVALILFSQLFAGLTKTIYYSAYWQVPYREIENDAKLNFFYVLAGMLGMIIAIIFIYFSFRFIILIYIAIMIILVGVITLSKFKLKFSLKKLYIISIVSGFNQTISGAGYGPLATYQEFMKDGDYKKTRAITSISEAILSGFGFLLYFIFYDVLTANLQLTIVLIITGIIGTPLGALSSNYLDKKKAKIVIGITSNILGILLFLRAFSLI